jgi:aspartate racemase
MVYNTETMKTAGVLGGMGPGTTADFYKEVNELSEQRNYPTRPEMLIWNVPLDYAVEQELLHNQTGLEKYLPFLINGAQKLQKAGSDFLVIPCNTVHELYDGFSREVDIPFLHIVEQTANLLERQNVGRVALLATGQTVGSQLYQGFLTKAGIDCVVPGPGQQKHLDDIVSYLVTAEGAASAKEDTPDKRWINGLVLEYAETIGTVVLGCTDFHILLEGADPNVVVDSMHVLAEATVDTIYS